MLIVISERTNAFFSNTNQQSTIRWQKGHSRRVPVDQINIDFRAVWRLFQYQVFHPQKPGKVTRFHETSLNDQGSL